MPYAKTGTYISTKKTIGVGGFSTYRIDWYADSSGNCIFDILNFNCLIDRVVSFPTYGGGGGNHDLYLYDRFDCDVLQGLCVGLLDAPTNYEVKTIYKSIGTGLSVPVFTMQNHTFRITNASASDAGALVIYFYEFK